ncbi:hypothetical protein [Afipia sp. GAS231]|uniref:hypothetical protein n=1 Tax=Afipia sp. GAS231 TaxID=1882747 RepID=UPI00087CD42C|nr:hypothetical protein [Afipia sp. GAS231]SDP47190.1 hypothetical protein SAMN05444050_6970 [Afipia sp. GAS231]
MRLVAALGAICALTQTASAEIGDCSSIADAAAKLACYNNEAPPKTSHATPVRSSAAKRPGGARPPAAVADSPKGIDRPTDEDAAVDAKVRGLCRGC